MPKHPAAVPKRRRKAAKPAAAPAFIASANIARRRLTKGQKAMAWAMIYPEPKRGVHSQLIKKLNWAWLRQGPPFASPLRPAPFARLGRGGYVRAREPGRCPRA